MPGSTRSYLQQPALKYNGRVLSERPSFFSQKWSCAFINALSRFSSRSMSAGAVSQVAFRDSLRPLIVLCGRRAFLTHFLGWSNSCRSPDSDHLFLFQYYGMRVFNEDIVFLASKGECVIASFQIRYCHISG